MTGGGYFPVGGDILKSQDRKIDEIIRLLTRLVELEEQNFRRRWGEDFQSAPSSSLSSSLFTTSGFLPRNTTGLPKKSSSN